MEPSMKKTTSVISVLLALLMLFSMTSVAANPLSVVSVTANGAELEGASIAASDAITVTFSNNVTDDSVLANNLSKINVKDSGGNKLSTVTVAPGSDNKVLTVSLGSVSKGSYTLTVAQGIKAKSGSVLEAKVEKSFTVNKGTGSGTGGGGGNNPLSFVSATADGKDLNGAALAATGTITITFDRGMNENQEANFAQISILDKDGKKVDGMTFSDFTKDEAGNSYTVLSYQDLAAGDYTLKLGKDLKANNGNTLDKAVTLNFTVNGASDNNNGSTSGFRAIFDMIVNAIKTIIGFFAKLFK